MCSGVSGRCAPADVEPQSWWIRYTSIPPRAQMAADGATAPFPRTLPQPVDGDLAVGWRSASTETTMTTAIPISAPRREPWNQGRLIGQKRPLKPKDIWTIRVRLQMEERRRDLAMFNLALDSKLKGCDLVRLRIDDVFVGGRARDRAAVIQTKTGRPVQFETTEETRAAIGDWLSVRDARRGGYLFPGRLQAQPHLSTRQNARMSIDGWSAPGSIARHTARTRCAGRHRHRFTRKPATCERAIAARPYEAGEHRSLSRDRGG